MVHAEVSRLAVGKQRSAGDVVGRQGNIDTEHEMLDWIVYHSKHGNRRVCILILMVIHVPRGGKSTGGNDGERFYDTDSDN